MKRRAFEGTGATAEECRARSPAVAAHAY